MGILQGARLSGAFLVLAGAVVAGEHRLDWWTIDGGGSIGQSSGGVYALSGTIGQPEAGRSSLGGVYLLESGFWSRGFRVTTDVEDGSPAADGPGVVDARLQARGIGPNPFRSRATVSFDLPVRQPVHVAVYDAGGRLCRTVVQAELEPGSHDLVWDGRDAGGRSVPSGIYFVVLRTPIGRHEQKLVKVN